MHGPVPTLAQLFLHTWAHGKQDHLLVRRGGAYTAIASVELYRRVARLRLALRSLGLRPGDCCALLSEGRWERVVADFALATSGIVGVLLDPALTREEIRHALAGSTARSILVSTREQREKIEEIQQRFSSLDNVIVFDAGLRNPTSGSVGFTQLIAGGPLSAKEQEEFHSSMEQFQPGDLASIIYSAGAQDPGMGYPLTHADWLSGLAAADLGIGPDDVALCVSPLGHLFERTIEYSCFLRGATVAHAATVESAMLGLAQVRPTLVAAGPEFFGEIYSQAKESWTGSSPSRQKLFHWAVQVGMRCNAYRLENRRAPADLRMELALANRLVLSPLRAKLGGRLRRFLSNGGTVTPEITEFFSAVGLGSREETTITLSARSSPDLRPAGAD